MAVCGIITEYNPLHNGHIHHIKACRQMADSVICIMSGNFTQRGEPAVADKWQRAVWAVNAGADLVLELPLIYASGSAESFADGAVRTLAALGSIDTLCFGSETADKDFFAKIAACQLSKAYTECLQEKLAGGISYHKAAAAAVSELTNISPAQLAEPNNILGIEYTKAIQKYTLPIQTIPIKRQGSGYHDTAVDSPLASASAIRGAVSRADFASIKAALPPYVYDYFTHNPPLPNNKIYETLILGKLKLAAAETLRSIDNISEGLENKILQAAVTAISAEELLGQVKSARYPYSRLKRILLHILLDIKADLLRSVLTQGPQYIRILAFNDNGRQILKRCKDSAALPLVMRTAQFLSTKTRQNTPATLLERMLALDTYATDLYRLLQNKPGGSDFLQSPLYIKNNL